MTELFIASYIVGSVWFAVVLIAHRKLRRKLISWDAEGLNLLCTKRDFLFDHGYTTETAMLVMEMDFNILGDSYIYKEELAILQEEWRCTREK